MTYRAPVVLGGDGLMQQGQAGDGLAADGAQWAAVIPGAPAAGALREGVRTWGGRDLLAVRSAQWPETPMQSLIGRDRTFGYTGRPGVNIFDTLPGSPSFTNIGTVTARACAVTSLATRAARASFVSVATAGAFAGAYNSTSASRFIVLGDGAGNGGFHYIARFVPADAATVSGAQMFVGISSSNSTFGAGEPSSFINQIGVAAISTSANLQIVFGGSVAQAPIDLGVNFPANSLSADIYEVHLFSSPFDNSKVSYQVDRNGGANVTGGFTATGNIANTTPGTTLPATSTLMMFRAYRGNNATALAVTLNVASLIVHTPY